MFDLRKHINSYRGEIDNLTTTTTLQPHQAAVNTASYNTQHSGGWLAVGALTGGTNSLLRDCNEHLPTARTQPCELDPHGP